MARRNRKLPKDPVEAQIDRISHDGRGIATVNERTTFIRDALPGERVMFKYTAKNSKFCEGQAVEVLDAAPERTAPKCAHYDMCGGCSTQHMTHAYQLEYKQKTLLEQLKHFGEIEPEEVLPPLTAPLWHYRRKARIGIRYVAAKEKVLVGFREKNGRFIADISNCPILHASVADFMDPFGDLIASLSCATEVPQVEISIGDKVTALILRHLANFTADDLMALAKFAEKHDFHLYLQPGGMDTIHRLWPAEGEEKLSYALPDHNIEIKFHPSDFTQVNADLNRQMVNRAIELLAPQAEDSILDLFCGLGNFSLPIARYCKHITGVEGDDKMVAKASENARHNQLDNTAFFSANLADEACLKGDWAKQTYDKILLDPPRSGAEVIVANIARFKANKIVYISCNPATLARDTKTLIEQGYQLEKAGIMDMFPGTGHVESIATFSRKKTSGQ